MADTKTTTPKTTFSTGIQATKNPELKFSVQNLRDEKVTCVFVRHLKDRQIQCRSMAPGTHSWRSYREYKFGQVNLNDIATFLCVHAKDLQAFIDGSGFDIS